MHILFYSKAPAYIKVEIFDLNCKYGLRSASAACYLNGLLGCGFDWALRVPLKYELRKKKPLNWMKLKEKIIWCKW